MPTPAPPIHRAPAWKILALQLYRLAALAIIVILIRNLHARMDIEGDSPVAVAEIKKFFPAADRLDLDPSEKRGHFVLDAAGERLGYIVRTSPICDNIVGYCGPTDTLIAFDREQKVLGIHVRSTRDTPAHMEDILHEGNEYFRSTWNGKTWDEVAAMDPVKAGIEGVSGATLTSMGMAEAISARLKYSNEAVAKQPNLAIRTRDIGMAVAIALSILIAFTRLRGDWRVRRGFQVAVIAYVGFINGDLIAQALLGGWTSSGVAWRIAPGLALLVAVAFVVPWTTKRPLYCHHICPHGAAQELLHLIGPRKLRYHLHPGLEHGLRWLPPILLLIVLVAVMLRQPLNLAEIEPFDAYVIQTAGWGTIIVAIIGLIASLFVPMAYCKYGCPTGALLDFVRSRGAGDGFSRRDGIAALMVAVAGLLYWQHVTLISWFDKL